LFVNRLAVFSNRFIRCTWRETWRAKEDALRLPVGRNDAALRKDTRSLRALCCGDRVFVQNQTGNYPHKWDKVGTVVEVLPFDQYVVKVAGSRRITKRNWRFLRTIPATASVDTTAFNPVGPIPLTPRLLDKPQASPTPTPSSTLSVHDQVGQYQTSHPPTWVHSQRQLHDEDKHDPERRLPSPRVLSSDIRVTEGPLPPLR